MADATLAASATKLATARNIDLSGVTATAQSFNGTAAITIPITAIPASLLTGTVALDSTGNSATADKLKSGRNIGLSGVTATAVAFDGSGDIAIVITGIPNGEMHTALEEYGEVDKEMYEYLLERNAHK